MFTNPTPDQIRSLLQEVKRIAVVGLSPRPERPSYRVSRAMQGFGYRIVPVRPAVSEVLGEKAYATLSDIPEKVDMVDVFRAGDQIDPIIDECIALGIPRLWLQDGVINEAAAERARAAGITVVMDRCVWRDYMDLLP
ncbi:MULTISPECIES: CoA-binding protein [Zoogloea]|jgi:predicted CoA-binding protein|uniref:CoA-binding protein n=1 Tax=Zoogloea oleivorans TaxID=1552750 RepID=A0A6C2CP37_9RHOO|nr:MULTISPECIES: CoA-binding protein [Zoogloea]MBT9498721.1 CoA-binding protein [Zoogloea sp.]MDD2670398.1 CoA-binding protein [Zoogloea sp.]MDY0037725.1 CoA-binding protein [Zoogloea oleivorans]TYC55273.1 CoA-binding protein [Zoogloea oleivorans]